MFKKIIIQTCHFNCTEDSVTQFVEGVLADRYIDYPKAALTEAIRKFLAGEVVEEKTYRDQGQLTVTTICLEDQKVVKR